MKKSLMVTCQLLLACLACLLAGVAQADLIIDNSGAGTSFTGTWEVSGGTLPYGANSLWARNGATYTWTMSSEPAGSYEVNMWWSGWSSRATSINVRINHAAGSATLVINQRQNAGQWNSLGTYYFNGTGSVVITAATGSTLSTCADAVWFKQVDINQIPTASISSISPNPANTGDIVSLTGSGSDLDGSIAAYSWDSSIDGHLSDAAAFVDVLSEGTHTISFKVQDDDGDWSPAVTQTLFVGAVPTEIIIDNRDSQTSRTGTWDVSGASGAYGADSVYSRNGTTFTWNFSTPQSGDYEVFMWWTGWPSRSPSVPVLITHAGGTASRTINQQQNPAIWNSQGVYHFDKSVSGSVRITASSGSTVSTCADAVRFQLVDSNQPPTAAITSISPSPALTTDTVTFTGSGSDADGAVTAYSWDSSIDGHLGDAAVIALTLTAGTHTITFKVKDNDEAWSAPVTQTLLVNYPAGNQPPTAAITSISPSPALTTDTITFTGSGSDADGTISAYSWDSSIDGHLGDAAVITGTLTAGTHTITFKVQDDNETWSPPVTQALVVQVPAANQPPVAAISSIAPSPALANDTIAFSGSGTDADGTVTAYSWDSSINGHLGDSGVISAMLSQGTHTITLAVKDDDEAWSAPVTRTLVVNPVPTEIIIDNRDSQTSRTGTWEASGASGAYGPDSVWSRNGTTFTWHFSPPETADFEVKMWWTGWPSRSSSVPVLITHAGGTASLTINQKLNPSQWNTLGTYPFQKGSAGSVRITAATGSTLSTCADAVRFVKASQQPVPPVANFSADKTTGIAPLTVQFTDLSAGGATSWLWDFGDGSTSIEQNPSHQYSATGQYSVSLTAANDAGSDAEIKSNYIIVNNNYENIYLCYGYGQSANFKSACTRMMEQMGASENNGVWTYTNASIGKTYFMRFVEDSNAMGAALREEGAHIIYNGHSNFGFGAMFADSAERNAQAIHDVQYIDDDRFTNFSSDMVSCKYDGMKYGQAYPNWEPVFKDGTSGLMPYDFPEGTPAYNYYQTYQVPGDPTLYRIELADGRYLERFPDSKCPPWYDPDGSLPDPDNPDHQMYFITNPETVFNNCALTGTWPAVKLTDTAAIQYSAYNYQYHAPGVGANKAVWTLLVHHPGVYAVVSTWQSDPANATDAKFTINHSFGTETVTADQTRTDGYNILGAYYFTPGTYTVELTDEANGNVVADAVALSPVDNPVGILQAEFNAVPASGSSPLSVKFIDYSLVGDVDNVIVSRLWDFGDGTTSTEQNPTHSYSSPGVYTISLHITDSASIVDTEVKSGLIVVGSAAAPAQAEFTARTRMDSDRTVVTFKDQSTGDITGWNWDFGDGSTSTKQNPIHAYSAYGSFTVTLTVSGPGGTDNETEVDYVYNIAGMSAADNAFSPNIKPHFRFGIYQKIICNTGAIKIPQNELKYGRMYYESCNSCNYFAGTLNKGTLICTTTDDELIMADNYLNYYLLGRSDQLILDFLNSKLNNHEIINFNLKPPSMR